MGDVVSIAPKLEAAHERRVAREAAEHERLSAICTSFGIDPSVLDLTFVVEREHGRTVSVELLEPDESR